MKTKKDSTTTEHALLHSEFEKKSGMHNINKSIELAKKITMTDIIDADAATLYKMTEIVARLQNSDTLEILDFEEYAGNMYPCS